MADACFSVPRLAAVYDALDGERDDLELYLEIVAEFDVRSVLDVGCGTGVLACEMARRGLQVTAVDPAQASVAVAQNKPFADRVQWLVGGVEAYDGPPVDVITMTANVAQVFVKNEDWEKCLAACRRSLRPAGWLLFETRDPQQQAWLGWTPERTRHSAPAPEGGQVSAWCELTDVAPPLISFRWTYTFDRDGAVLTSDSTLRFPQPRELTDSLSANGFKTREIRDAPDRPGAELVYLAQRE
jgi:SAM-dependent methyltransferase